MNDSKPSSEQLRLLVSTFLWLRCNRRVRKKTEGGGWISRPFVQKEWLSDFPKETQKMIKTMARNMKKGTESPRRTYGRVMFGER